MTYPDEEELLFRVFGRKNLEKLGIKLGMPPAVILVNKFFKFLPEPEETLEGRVEQLEDEVRRLRKKIKPPIRHPTKADLVYEKFRGKLEKEHFGKVVALDVDSETVVGVGNTVLEAYHEARKKSSKTKFSYKRVGYPYVYRL